jgi:hypothetical protein
MVNDLKMLSTVLLSSLILTLLHVYAVFITVVQAQLYQTSAHTLDVSVKVNASLVLECPAQKSPRPEILWIRDDRTLANRGLLSPLVNANRYYLFN